MTLAGYKQTIASATSESDPLIIVRCSCDVYIRIKLDDNALKRSLPPQENGFFRVQNDLRTWLDARTACNDLKAGATLISLTSADVESKVLEMFGGFSSGTGQLDDPDANSGAGANGYWTGGSDLTNLAVDPTDVLTSDDTEFKWDADGDVFWRWVSNCFV